MLELAQVTAAIAALIAAIASIVSVFKIKSVEHTFNSRMSEFIQLTAATAKAEGRREAEEERQ